MKFNRYLAMAVGGTAVLVLLVGVRLWRHEYENAFWVAFCGMGGAIGGYLGAK